jgi:hypothetical protein
MSRLQHATSFAVVPLYVEKARPPNSLSATRHRSSFVCSQSLEMSRFDGNGVCPASAGDVGDGEVWGRSRTEEPRARRMAEVRERDWSSFVAVPEAGAAVSAR